MDVRPRRRDHSEEPSLPIADSGIALSDVTEASPAAQRTSLSLSQLRPRDLHNFLFLTLLYFLQGIPVGLAFGSVPFILKEKLSYAQIGLFSLASYPYSLKLFWSPIVDAFYWRNFGRRRSWIVPIQFFSSLALIYLGFRVEPLLKDPMKALPTITCFFFILVFGCATQDIAVDGWALTLLSSEALPYASTAQTVGMNTGYFTSYTVFLALSSKEFANKFFRTVPREDGLVTLGGYLCFCGLVYIVVTVWVALGKKEEHSPSEFGLDGIDPWRGTARIYRSIWDIVQLTPMKQLILVHLIAKIPFQAAEAVTNLKLIEKGLSKEDLAVIVLIDFPFEIVFGYQAARWATKVSPLQPWMWAFVGRVCFSMISMTQVMFFPKSGTTFPYLCYVTIIHILGAFMSTVQFVSITAFHTQIADPEIGGTYMTLINTICNFGGQWPRVLVLAGVDWFTRASCSTTGLSCVSELGKKECTAARGVCNIEQDGYYIMNVGCVVIGVILFYGYIKETLERLQFLPTSAWRSNKKNVH